MNEIKGVLLKPQEHPAGTHTPLQCVDECHQGEWCRAHGKCRSGDISRCDCARTDIQMCPSRVAASEHQTTLTNARPHGTLSQGPISARFVRQDLHTKTDENFYAKPQVECIYDAAAVKTVGDIRTWIQNFGRDETWRTKIMPRFCGTHIPQDQCSDAVKADEKGCSRFFSEGEEGEMCTEWMNEPENQRELESQIRKFCSGRDTMDCRCFNRSLDEMYKKIVENVELQEAPIPDVCWWVSCKDTSATLIPPSDEEAKKNCPRRFCSIITRAGEKAELALRGSKQKIDCTNPSAGDDDGGDDGNGGDGVNWKLWIGVSVGVVLLGGILLYFLMRKRPR